MIVVGEREVGKGNIDQVLLMMDTAKLKQLHMITLVVILRGGGRETVVRTQWVKRVLWLKTHHPLLPFAVEGASDVPLS